MSVERPCLEETVTFTCTALGANLRWVLSDDYRVDVSRSTDLNIPFMPLTAPGYTVTLIAINATSLISTLSRRAENGTNVICTDPPNVVVGSATIQLTSELETTISELYGSWLY